LETIRFTDYDNKGIVKGFNGHHALLYTKMSWFSLLDSCGNNPGHNYNKLPPSSTNHGSLAIGLAQ